MGKGDKKPKPVTKKKNTGGEYNGLRYGVASMQGLRQTMEDAHRVSLALPGQMRNCAFAGVFDGHAGDRTSTYTSRNLLRMILQNISTRASENSQDSDVMQNQQLIKTAIAESFLKLDDTMRKKIPIDDNSGTTAVCLFATQTHFYFANCGDSRAILCRDDKTYFATTDHKPIKREEKKRIIAAGGDVRRNRVNGCLALSRALGDFDFKNNANMGQCDQMVSPQPEITVIERNHDLDQFIVLACDGVFDVISNHELVRFIRNQMIKSSNIRIICNNVVDHCLERGSRDNISIVLITLPGCPKQEDLYRKRKLDLIEMNHVIRSKKARTGNKPPPEESDKVTNDAGNSDSKNLSPKENVPQVKDTKIPQAINNTTQASTKEKRSPNAFIIYFLAYWKKYGGNICQAAKTCGESWSRLRESVKRSYKPQYLAARSRNSKLIKTA